MRSPPGGDAYAIRETVRDVLRQLYFERMYMAISALFAQRGTTDANSALACLSLISSLLESLESVSRRRRALFPRSAFPEA